MGQLLSLPRNFKNKDWEPINIIQHICDFSHRQYCYLEHIKVSKIYLCVRYHSGVSNFQYHILIPYSLPCLVLEIVFHDSVSVLSLLQGSEHILEHGVAHGCIRVHLHHHCFGKPRPVLCCCLEVFHRIVVPSLLSKEHTPLAEGIGSRLALTLAQLSPCQDLSKPSPADQPSEAPGLGCCRRMDVLG